MNNTDPQAAVCKLLDHFGIDWKGAHRAVVTVDSWKDAGLVSVQLTYCVVNDKDEFELSEQQYEVKRSLNNA